MEQHDAHAFEADALDGIPLPRERTLLYGHAPAETVLLDAYRSARMHHAWILSGPKGIGKATLAFRFARFVLAHPDPSSEAARAASDLWLSPEDPTFRKVAAGAHPGILHLKRPYDAKRKSKDKFKQDLTVDEVRRAVPFFGSTGAQGSWRICIVDAADDMNQNAANALLKVLEEPPKRSLFLVLAHAPGRLLPTIRSRCRMLSTKPLADGEVAAGLAEFGIADTNTRESARATELADGSLRKAITLASSDAIELADGFSALVRQLPDVDVAQVHGFADAVSRNGAEDAWTLFQDLVADHLHARLDPASGPALQRLVRVAEVWEKTNRAAREADAFNLDRKQLVLNVFRDLAETARMP
ncbi:DNA polymerase III subunit delta' [Stappia stellulata]|uniref:DNA polymerase III subunit delta' n=1 Tax=Stappia stellulata TaxID=71235 RepID=UPI000420A459|nr:DNA polymerase III subunit delta' [Stappia stellulata]